MLGRGKSIILQISAENSALLLTNCNDSCDESVEIIDGDLDSAFHLQKYLSSEFIDKKDINDLEVSQILKDIRIKNYKQCNHWSFECQLFCY